MQNFNLTNTITALSDLVVAIDHANTDPSDTVRHDIVQGHAKYMYSIPYLEATDKDGKHQSLPLDSKSFGSRPEDTVSSKKYEYDLTSHTSPITEATEGKIAALEYNIKENERGAKEVFVPYKEAQLREYNQNVDEYLKIFDKYLGVDPNKKP